MANHYVLSLDGPLFRQQRELLIGLAASTRQGRQTSLGPAENQLLEGLVELTDAIADQADGFGIECLIAETSED
jgi:hypothetical protein